MENLRTKKVLVAGYESSHNTTTTPLAAGGTFTGQWDRVQHFQALAVNCKTDQDGLMYIDVSDDADTVDKTITHYAKAGEADTHRITITRKWFRVRFANTSASAQTYLRISNQVSQFSQLSHTRTSGISQDVDTIIVRAIDSETDVAAGRFTGESIVNVSGQNNDISTGSVPEDIWSVGGVYTGFPVSTLETVSVVSSSAADAAAGTGARTVKIYGLDGNYAAQEETITLNGTTPVASVNTYRRVRRMTVESAGSGGVNAGTLTANHTTTTANIFAGVIIGRNVSDSAVYTVPAGYTAYMRNINAAARDGATAALNGHLWVRPFGGVFQARRPFIVSSAYRLQDIIYGGLVFTEKTDISIRIYESSANNVRVTAGFDLLVIKN